jgi:hypothetical protein
MNANDNENNNASQTGRPPAGLATCRKAARLVDEVKREVFTEYQAALGANEQLLRLALNEADALAQQTGYPHLVLPLLAAEKARNAARWQFRQQFLLRSNDPLAA